MIITKSTVTKITVKEIKNLDPVSIYLEDYSKGKGKITISCWDKSWHSFWPRMGDCSISEFFLSCDNHYLAKNLSKIRPTIPDYEKLKQLIEEIYDLWLDRSDKTMRDILGDDCFFGIPEKENHEYGYLLRVIDATKQALKKLVGRE